MLTLILDFIREHMTRAGDIGPLRVLTYTTVRTALALLGSFALSLALGPRMIARLRALKAGQVIRTTKTAGAIDLASMHGAKAGTPTMGGVIMMISMAVPVVLLCRLDNPYVALLAMSAFGYGALGFYDDYLKIVKKHHGGVSPRGKLVVQAGLGLFIGLALYAGDWNVHYAVMGRDGYGYLTVPFFKYFYPHLGLWFAPFAMFVMMGASNAVNLTDGLDGLAIGVSIANITAFMIVAYLVSRVDFSSYLFVPYIRDGGEIVVFLAALLGASMGFLWFNSHPAEVFMGDTGSMMLGGVLGATALMLKQELLLVVIGGVFVAEALSVMAQVGSVKLTGTRVLRMSPLHHHYERLGLAESKIINRFWIVSWILALAGLSMLKLR